MTLEAEWKLAEPGLSHIEVKGSSRNRLVRVRGCSSPLHCVGLGTDAAVFVHEALPAYAFKLYSPQAMHKKEVEASVYAKLQGSPYFPVCHGIGDRYLVLSMERGPTLYDCLVEGIEVPAQAMQDVEQARAFVRSQGLNPRDIHLKNILLQEGRGKLLDVSEYIKPGNDRRWEHLMLAYRYGYPWLRGKRVPGRLLELLKLGYGLIFGRGAWLQHRAGKPLPPARSQAEPPSEP